MAPSLHESRVILPAVPAYASLPQPPRPQRLWTGALLRSLRRKAGRTQEDLARALGVSDSTWSRFEQGTLPIPLEVTAFVEDLLGAPSGILQARAELLTAHYKGATGTAAWRYRVVEQLR